MRFSQRMGYRPVKTVLQVESIDVDLKNRLWNILMDDYFDKLYNVGSYGEETDKIAICKFIWTDFFTLPLDEVRISNGCPSPDFIISYIRSWFFEAAWYEIYDLVEFLSPYVEDFVEKCNIALEKEVSAYRVVDDKVVQITSEGEIAEIEEALAGSDEWASVNTHLNAALSFLADRKNPDYRNSIKESISAVESLCLKIGGNTNGKFGDALTEIEKKMHLHGSLKTAFKALYGYTSDAGGIRHALIDDDTTPTFEDAKFMLVSCSAFINYLKAKMQL